MDPLAIIKNIIHDDRNGALSLGRVPLRVGSVHTHPPGHSSQRHRSHSPVLETIRSAIAATNVSATPTITGLYGTVHSPAPTPATTVAATRQMHIPLSPPLPPHHPYPYVPQRPSQPLKEKYDKVSILKDAKSPLDERNTPRVHRRSTVAEDMNGLRRQLYTSGVEESSMSVYPAPVGVSMVEMGTSPGMAVGSPLARSEYSQRRGAVHMPGINDDVALQLLETQQELLTLLKSTGISSLYENERGWEGDIPQMPSQGKAGRVLTPYDSTQQQQQQRRFENPYPVPREVRRRVMTPVDY